MGVPKKLTYLYARVVGLVNEFLKNATEDKRFCAVFILNGRKPERIVLVGLFSPEKASQIVSAVITRASEDLGWPDDVVDTLLELANNVIWESPFWLDQPQDVEATLDEIDLSDGFSEDSLPYIVLAHPVTRSNLHILQYRKHVHWVYSPYLVKVGTRSDGKNVYYCGAEWTKAKVRA